LIVVSVNSFTGCRATALDAAAAGSQALSVAPFRFSSVGTSAAVPSAASGVAAASSSRGLVSLSRRSASAQRIDYSPSGGLPMRRLSESESVSACS
jgi:hypothetical protein